jgi:hypothetical protein
MFRIYLYPVLPFSWVKYLRLFRKRTYTYRSILVCIFLYTFQLAQLSEQLNFKSNIYVYREHFNAHHFEYIYNKMTANDET